MPPDTISDAAIGRAVRAVFVEAKARGYDAGLHTSFCADVVLVIGRVRRPGVGGAGEAKVGEVREVIAWMVGRVGG